MAELPDDTLRFIDAARAVCVACGSATFTQPSEASPALQMQFATSDNATKFVHAMGDLFRASGFLSCSTPVVDHPALEFATATLEAPPTKPLDVEVRQWAVERVERMPLYEIGRAHV